MFSRAYGFCDEGFIVTFPRIQVSIEIKEDMGDIKFGSFIKKKILDSQDLKEVEKNTLLNYPVVYLHSWKDKNQKLKIYIGETIDIERRSEEHEKKSE